MIYTKDINGRQIFSSCKTIELNGRWVSNPTMELIVMAGWEQYSPPSTSPNQVEEPSYEELVNEFIRERYSASDEFAVIRQKDEKPEEFEAYYSYCEECKLRARQIIDPQWEAEHKEEQESDESQR